MFEHQETKHLPYTPAQLFDLVADVERYPQFLPWCQRVSIIEHHDDGFTARIEAGSGSLTGVFTSRDRLYKPPPEAREDPQSVWRIDVDSHDGPFRRLVNAWTFTPQPEGCLVGFMIRFQFSSFMMNTLFQPFFSHVARSMVDAFEKRARTLYP
ncbi:MAG: type II toxin-antitoxin system RatA family toxin [Alphaproteobacteria bacterium GM202ARS2]|nr:type II toxin-antitoxin system RatA family toxin [Alphaproteobacteria bacterium GM202ARS2]